MKINEILMPVMIAPVPRARISQESSVSLVSLIVSAILPQRPRENVKSVEREPLCSLWLCGKKQLTSLSRFYARALTPFLQSNHRRKQHNSRHIRE